ncbi:unnamed protein product [Cylicocyclus nassatus]|uniref:Protein kinase domain-containing protein n=1 Tax=Cylicocyclus nassatus TaxID=53992 RepID=A0AA36DKI5_CYLNA|nr:unnamed protein product [Cylicocyclus nassatus]
MSAQDGSASKQIPLAQRILALQARNKRQLHMCEVSRTSQSEGNKENSYLSSSMTRQNKTAPAGEMFDLSKMNDSLGAVRHNLSTQASEEPRHHKSAQRVIKDRHLVTPKTPKLSAIPEKAHAKDRISRLDNIGLKSPADNLIKTRSKSAGTKSPSSLCAETPRSMGGLRPSSSTSSLNNKVMIINNHSYIWLNVLGKGGSSRVYEVFDEARSEVCALKVVDLGDDPVVRDCYLNEIELLNSLQGSPYVIKMIEYELRECENTLYVVMEKGDIDLATFLKTRRSEIDSNFVRYHWNEMLRCVKVIHDRKIVHSDLKPANFLLVKGRLKLIDFGIAAGIPNDMTAAIKESQMGTLSYMAPEVLQGEGCDGKYKIPLKADVWSLGCILYNIVYGHLPFPMKSQAAKMAAIVSPEYVIDFPDCHEPRLVDVMKRCLVRDVHDRADVNELLEHPYLTGSSSRAASPDSSLSGPPLDFLAIAKELQNNTPNTMARRLEELTKGAQLHAAGDGGDPARKVLDFD